MTKIRFRDSLANMVGEFVALTKSPDFRPNAQSSQFLKDVVNDEKNAWKSRNAQIFMDIERPLHFRTNSTNSGYRNMPQNEGFMNGRRQSAPIVKGAPARLLQRLRGGSKKGKYDVEQRNEENNLSNRNSIESCRRSSVISESDETISNMSYSRRSSHDSCQENAQASGFRF